MEKTIIGVLASFDDVTKNNELIATIEKLYNSNKELLEKFHFVFTGGTFNRLILNNDETQGGEINHFRNREINEFIIANSTVLPSYREGGIVMLSYLITQRICSILWMFLTPLTNHWQNPEDIALMRLSDVHRTKKLMNSGSVEEWFETEAELDIHKNPQTFPGKFKLKSSGGYLQISQNVRWGNIYNEIAYQPDTGFPEMSNLANVSIALIAHNEMKSRMIEFAVDYENELAKFDKIFTTGTTGKQILESTHKLRDKVNLYHSGPIGGDIEIANEILNSTCHVVIFFIDPLNPHPHYADIKVVQGACMRHNRVRMVGNELQAREWMERVIRNKIASSMKNRVNTNNY
jgi:methylglyoxal synthase